MQYEHFRNSKVVLYNQAKLALLVPLALLCPVPIGVRLMSVAAFLLILGMTFAPQFAAVGALLAIQSIGGDFAAVVVVPPPTLDMPAKSIRSVLDRTG